MAQSAKYYKGKFFNQVPTPMNPEDSSMWDALWQLLRGIPNRRPDQPVPTKTFKKSFLDQKKNKNRFIWFGHSSFLLLIDDIRILVDPVFSKSASPVPFIGPKPFAYSNPFTADQFTEIDVVLISHDHFDHLDKSTIQKIHQKVQLFLTPLGVGKYLKKWGVSPEKVHELDWSMEHSFNGNIKFIAQSGRHFSGRGMWNRMSTLWCSWIIETGEQKIFYSGDSGYGPHYKEIGEKYGPFDLAFLECGQYNENWPLIHMMPEETVQAAIDTQSRTFVPVHWGKFAISLHAWEEPLTRVKKEAESKNQNILLPGFGEIIQF